MAPSTEQLSVSLAGNRDDQICPENVPLILVWQPHALNLADPFAATFLVPPYGIRP
jgi:hypothetical protein